ncbi:serine hydrolase domain-containing protein [Armatimonas sp.]|uniref:serine hydrolase domain-containing protein n=1 Tax=Armatimonas sp. TaxID=1872638 RepID=UPI00286BA5F7|nr:serine hydrolase domain-containing protein [Armatimonas sp.]
MDKSFTKAKQELQRALAAGELVGGVHLVMHKGKVIHLEAVGLRDREEKKPFTADTLVRMYSMTKPITSVAAMMLWEHGKFQLDDPLSKYIPAFAHSTVMDGKGGRTAPKRPLTVRDLFRHTSGYSYGDGDPAIGVAFAKEGLLYRPPVGMLPPKLTIEKAAEALARVPALHHPGERFTYGLSVDILGRLIEIWSGKTLDRYFQQAMLGPLEMRDTAFVVPKDKRARFASCYTGQDSKLTLVDAAATSPYNEGFEFLGGGSGLVSTILDYAKFCQLVVDDGVHKGKRLLKSDTLKLMFTDQLNGVGGAFRFGLGFALEDVMIGSGSGARKALRGSWGGYANTDFNIVPREKLFHIFVQQRVPSAPGLGNRLATMVYQEL